MPARDLFFEQAAKLHLERIRARRKTEGQIQKTVVDRLQGEREAQPAIRCIASGSRRLASATPLDFPSYLRKTCHGSYGHSGQILNFPQPLSVRPRERTVIRTAG